MCCAMWRIFTLSVFSAAFILPSGHEGSGISFFFPALLFIKYTVSYEISVGTIVRAQAPETVAFSLYRILFKIVSDYIGS